MSQAEITAKKTGLKRRSSTRSASAIATTTITSLYSLPPLKKSRITSISHKLASTGLRKTQIHSNIHTLRFPERKENDDLAVILGETNTGNSNYDLPVRSLDDFTMYDARSRRPAIPPTNYDIEQSRNTFFAAGIVGVVREHSDSDSDSISNHEEEKVPVELSCIHELWFGADSMDEESSEFSIWIRTEFAWYKLLQSSSSFSRCFEALRDECGRKMKRARTQGADEKKLDPVVTPTVSLLAESLALRSQLIIGHAIDVDEDLAYICDPDVSFDFVLHDSDSEDIRWGCQIPSTELYESVFFGGEEYFVGDTVAILPPEDTKNPNETRSWFCEIRYFFERKESTRGKEIKTKMFHGRWFEHGSRTALAEAAGPQELFMMDICDDNPIATIVQKIHVRLIEDGRTPVKVASTDVGSTNFNISYKWSPARMTFSTFDPEAEAETVNDWIRLIGVQPSHASCYACALRDVTRVRGKCNKAKDAISIFGVDYHVSDFVYLYTQSSSLAIAQVKDLLLDEPNDKLEVQMLEKVQLHVSSSDRTNFRSVKFSNTLRVVSACDLDGKCRIRSKFEVKKRGQEFLDEWLEDYDNFVLLDQVSPLKQCHICVAEEEVLFQAIRTKKKLRAMDLFAGAGGLTTGMDASGFVDSCWAVELNSSPALTLKANYPHLKVYNQNANTLLRHAVEGDKHPLYAIGDRFEQLPPLPKPGEVDIIMGGPPCQPFSLANGQRHEVTDDIRRTCIPTMLSFVEHFSPRFVLIENVPGLLTYRLTGAETENDKVRGIEGGMVKFIMRTLTALGYQCQVRLLNSVDYGAPQQRNRVIFWAARVGLDLPEWPIPTHVPRGRYHHAPRYIRLAGEEHRIPIATRTPFEEEGETERRAPFFAVTVGEAVSDLQSWDWENPAEVLPEIDTRRSGVETFVAHSSSMLDIAGYDYPVSYASDPQSDYQARLRCSKRVGHHYTPIFSSYVIERTVNIPMRPGANISDLPDALRVGARKSGFLPNSGQFTRLDAKKQFPTITTLFRPESRHAAILHPWDRRIISVREAARAQGFPDTYDFKSASKTTRKRIQDEYKQIGNAIPSQLGYALGRALGLGLVKSTLRMKDAGFCERPMSEEL